MTQRWSRPDRYLLKFHPPQIIRIMQHDPQDEKNLDDDEKFSFYHKQWWKKFEYFYDAPMEKYLWNKDVDPKTYKKTDFIEQVASDRDKLIDCVMFMSQQRTNATSHFFTINSALITLYIYAIAKEDWFGYLIAIFTFFFLSIAICITWRIKIESYIQQNTAYFSAIRQYQKYLPSKPHGDAITKVLNESRETVFHPSFEMDRWMPIIFLIWYTVLFSYNIILYFIP